MEVKINWSVQRRKVADLKLWDKNPRKISKEAFEKLKNRIIERGFHDVLKIDTDNTVLSGNQRKQALVDLGIEEVDVKVPERALTEVERDQVALESNRNDGDWDTDILANEFDEELLKDVGFTNEDLGIGKPYKEIVEDQIPNDAENRVKLGEVWELGRHTLMCGDSSVVENFNKLVGDTHFKLFCTDPPYGKLKIFNQKGQVGKANLARAKNYGAYANEGTFDLKPILDITYGRYDNIIVWGGNYFSTNILPIRTSWLCWNKAASDGGSWFSDFELAWTDLPITAKIFNHKWQGMIREGDKIEREHPTQKPVELYAWQLDNWTDKDDNILELFGGSGSLLIAAEQLERNCFMMEISPKYCDIIIKRWEKLTGEKAVKVNG